MTHPDIVFKNQMGFFFCWMTVFMIVRIISVLLIPKVFIEGEDIFCSADGELWYVLDDLGNAFITLNVIVANLQVAMVRAVLVTAPYKGGYFG